jgi:nitrate/nitrite transport system ATP-binding protein
MGLAEAKDKRPLEISSGMKQAVGIAGALAMRPKILLLDEPFGGLDAEARAHLRTVLNEMHGELGLTILMATHAIDEALRLADRIAMLTSGPAARIGDVIAIAAARPRRLDPALLEARAAVTAFLSRQQLFGEAA